MVRRQVGSWAMGFLVLWLLTGASATVAAFACSSSRTSAGDGGPGDGAAPVDGTTPTPDGRSPGDAGVDAARAEGGGDGAMYISTHQAPFASGQPNYSNVIEYLCPQAAIASLTIEIEWNAVEGPDGGYTFSKIDDDLAALTAACDAKRAGAPPIRVNIVWAPATEGTKNGSTPAYVFGEPWAKATHAAHPQDMAVCGAYTGGPSSPWRRAGCGDAGCAYNVASAINPSGDTSGLPISYEAPFKTAWMNFIEATIAHYKAPGGGVTSADLGYFRFGMTQGGEASPLCNGVWPDPAGTADAGPNFKNDYLQYVSDLTTFQGMQDPSWAGHASLIFDSHAVGVVPDETYASSEATYAVTAPHGPWGFGTNGLQYSDIADLAKGCTSDWCADFDEYADSGAPLYLQTLCASQPDTPPGTTWCNPKDGAPVGDEQQGSTGALTLVMPFAAAHHARYSENYLCDLFLAFAPSEGVYIDAGCWNGASGDWYSSYHAAYAKTFAGIAAK